MSYYFPEGSIFQFSTTLAAPVTVTAVTNANPAVATATAHGYANADELLIASGWADVNNNIYRAAGVAANTFQLQGLDSSNTSFYPAGSGTGTARRISGWQTIGQVLGVQSQGGDARFAEFQELASRNATRVPIGFNASSLTLTLGYDPALASQTAMLAISRVLQACAIKILTGGNGAIYMYGNLSISEVPSFNPGQPLTIQAAITNQGRITSY